MKTTTRKPASDPMAIPDFLKIPREQRAEAWAKNPPKVVPDFVPKRIRDEDPATEQFRRELEEHKRAKSLARISKMKARQESKDRTGMRWNLKRSRWEPDPFYVASAPKASALVRTPAAPKVSAKVPVNDATDWSRVTKDTAQHLAKANGVWDDKYAKLKDGLLVMTVTNRLKGVVKRGGQVKWN